MNNVRVLQLGGQDLRERYSIPEEAEWFFEPDVTSEEKEYDLAILARCVSAEEAAALRKLLRCRCLYVTEELAVDGLTLNLLAEKRAEALREDEWKSFLRDSLPLFYPYSYGEKFSPQSLVIADGFKGDVSWHGYTDVTLSGSFGEEMTEVAFWAGSIPLTRSQPLDLYLEFGAEGVEISLRVIQFVSGAVSEIQKEWLFSQDQLKNPVTVENRDADGSLFLSLLAKGTGTLKIRELHDRYSRKELGTFLPGGERYADSDGEEVFAYFDPGDRKPPLCVYFSGYKTQEGFEGLRMMRRMGTPFLLLTESRLEGGDFYLGSKEYEDRVSSIIKKYAASLGFRKEEILLSGLSMGTFGAAYYACRIQPGYVLLGKPVLNLGNVAANEQLGRPGEFATSLDVLWKNTGSLDAVERAFLNRMLIMGFSDTLHRQDRISPELAFSNAEGLVTVLQQAIKNETARKAWIDHQEKAAMTEKEESYRQVLGI
ncbi:MAG: accessory Sec system protein Asp2 [Eubacterium sp.]|nr:accessory Sec system protein Asp2 [Eubacterium sp.]